MFELEVRPRERTLNGSMFCYVAQLLAVYPVTIVAGLPVFFLLSKMGLDRSLADGVEFAGFGALVCLYMGAVTGSISGRVFPSLARTGAWIWLPPAVLVVYDIFPLLIGRRLAPSLYDYVYASGSNEGLGVFLFTLPLCSVIGYSFGIWFGARRVGPLSRTWKPWVFAVTLWLGTFVAAATAMPGIERRMVERDRKIRFVVRQGGTILAPEAGPLCAAPHSVPSANQVVLPGGSYLQVLEHVDCANGPKPGVDRVRVLHGVDNTVEGWVRSSEVWRPLPLR